MPERRRVMGDRTGEQALRRRLLGLEQLLFAGAGCVAGLLVVALVFPGPGGGDYFVAGLAGGVAGTVLHVLVRGLGLPLPGPHRRRRARENGARAGQSAAGPRPDRPTTKS